MPCSRSVTEPRDQHFDGDPFCSMAKLQHRGIRVETLGFMPLCIQYVGMGLTIGLVGLGLRRAAKLPEADPCRADLHSLSASAHFVTSGSIQLATRTLYILPILSRPVR